MFTVKLVSILRGWDTSAGTTRNHSKQSRQNKGSPARKSPARDRRRAIDTKRSTELQAERIESQLLRMARRVGGMSRGDGRVWLAIRLHVHGFCEAVGHGIRLESRIGF